MSQPVPVISQHTLERVGLVMLTVIAPLVVFAGMMLTLYLCVAGLIPPLRGAPEPMASWSFSLLANALAVPFLLAQCYCGYRLVRVSDPERHSDHKPAYAPTAALATSASLALTLVAYAVLSALRSP